MMRALRAILVISAVWAGLWLLVGIGFALVLGRGDDIDLVPPPLLFFPIALTIWGAFSGAVFAGLLAFTERNRTLESLSITRVSLWGAIASLTVPVLITVYDALSRSWTQALDEWLAIVMITGLSVLQGGVCAGGTLAIARHRPA